MSINYRAIIALFITGASLTGCNRPAEVRYRISVEVNDRGTIRFGSDVWSFALAKSIMPLASPDNSRFHGDGVAVEILGRGPLFALVDPAAMHHENLFGDSLRARSETKLSGISGLA